MSIDNKAYIKKQRKKAFMFISLCTLFAAFNIWIGIVNWNYVSIINFVAAVFFIVAICMWINTLKLLAELEKIENEY